MKYRNDIEDLASSNLPSQDTEKGKMTKVNETREEGWKLTESSTGSSLYFDTEEGPRSVCTIPVTEELYRGLGQNLPRRQGLEKEKPCLTRDAKRKPRGN